MEFTQQNLVEIIVIFVATTSLMILARLVKTRIVQSQTKYVNNPNVEIPRWLQELQPQHPAPSSASAVSNKQNLPAWLKTKTPETLRLYESLDHAFAGSSIGIMSGMTVVIWQIIHPDKTAHVIIPGILGGAFSSILTGNELPTGMKIIVGVIAGTCVAVLMLATDIGPLSKLLGIVVGAIIGTIVGWIIGRQVNSNRTSA